MKRVVAPVLALDIGNVCLKLKPRRCAAAFGYASLPLLLKALPALSAASRMLETGRIDKDAFLGRVRDALPAALDLSEEQLEAAWCSMLGEEIRGMAQLVDDAVTAGVEPVFLSDVSAFHYGLVSRKLSFMDRMAGAVLSYEVGALKPDPAMFETMEQRFCDGGVPTLYVDDRADCVEAARARGWQAYRFGSSQGAREAFARAR